MVFEQGPYLVAALLCEKALQDKDNVISMIRAVDRVVNAGGPGAPRQMPPFPVNLTLVVVLKAGAARGRSSVKVRPADPTGTSLGETEIPIFFGDSPDAGVNLLVNFALTASHEGIYWIDILFDDQVLTRTPLRIEYLPLQTGSQSQPSGSSQ